METIHIIELIWFWNQIPVNVSLRGILVTSAGKKCDPGILVIDV